jgi:hypothetical protein
MIIRTKRHEISGIYKKARFVCHGRFRKAEVLAKVSLKMSEKDPALRVTKAVADYYSVA